LLQTETEPPTAKTNPIDPAWKDPNFIDLSYKIIVENEIVKNYELPESVLSLLGESQAVVYCVIDDILASAMNCHTLERIYKVEEQKKLKPIKQKKDFSKIHETNMMDNNTLRRIQMNYYPNLQDTMRKIPQYDKEAALITMNYIQEL